MEHAITYYDERNCLATTPHRRGALLAMQQLVWRADLDAETLWLFGEIDVEEERFSDMLLRASAMRMVATELRDTMRQLRHVTLFEEHFVQKLESHFRYIHHVRRKRARAAGL